MKLVLGCIAIPALLAAQQPGLRPARPELLRLERLVNPVAGPNRLDVDVTLLSGGAPFAVTRRRLDAGRGDAIAQGGLSDLRFYDKGGREVPYLLVDPPTAAPEWRGSTLLAVARTDSTSGFEADLGRAQPIDRVRVNGIPAPFLKRMRLEGSGDRARWTLLVDEGTLFDLPDERLRQTELELVPGEYRYLRVTWDDRRSGRVPAPSSVEARLRSVGGAAPTLRADIPFERRASEPRVSRYRLRLPGARLPIAALELTVRGGNVLRDARVSEPRLERDLVEPAPLGSATLRRAQRGDLAASSLVIPITSPTEAALDLVIDDGDNPPLDLTGVTAVFATLPYIYFESPSTDALTARYGGERIAPPRYDLEAERDRVPALQLAQAQWKGGPGAVRESGAAVAAAAPPPMLGAPLDDRAFRWRREIPAGPNGLTTVPLDAAVLSHSRRFPDVRIASDGKQVPFLLERLDEPLSLDLGAAPELGARDLHDASTRAETHTHYRVKLPYPNLPDSRLVLTTPARVFQRLVAVDVERPAGGAQRGPWLQRIVNATWSHADPESPAPALTIALPPLDASEVVLIVDEGDNSKLPLDRMTLLLPAYRVRFVRDGTAPLSLVYGRADLAQPSYDFALLAPRLLGAPATEVVAGPEQSGDGPKVSALPMTVFWAILGVAVVAMVIVIARLVMKGGGGVTGTSESAS